MQNLYNKMIADGYFRGDDGEVNFSFEEFCDALNDQENARNFFHNMVDDGYFRDENGELSLSEEDFLTMIGSMRPKQDFYPITENQRGVLIDWEMHREALQYNIPKVLKIKDVDATRLRDAVIQVINAHPYIKTHFIQKDGDVMQLQLDGDEPVVTVETIGFEPDREFFQKRVRPFDLFRDRLYRFEIYQTPTQVFLFQDVHHSVFDGISGLVVMNDIQRVLNGETLSVEPFSAFDEAVEEAELLAGKAGEEAERYFDKLLGQCESTVYPHSSEGTGDSGFGTYEFTVPSEKINEFCRKAGVTPNAYFATILSQLLHRVTRDESILFSTIDNGRTRAEKMQSVGMFVKTLPVTSVLNLQAAMSTSVEKAVKDMHRQLMDTLSYSYYSPYTIHHPLSTIHHPLSTIHHPPSTIHYPPSTITCVRRSSTSTMAISLHRQPGRLRLKS